MLKNNLKYFMGAIYGWNWVCFWICLISGKGTDVTNFHVGSLQCSHLIADIKGKFINDAFYCISFLQCVAHILKRKIKVTFFYPAQRYNTTRNDCFLKPFIWLVVRHSGLRSQNTTSRFERPYLNNSPSIGLSCVMLEESCLFWQNPNL